MIKFVNFRLLSLLISSKNLLSESSKNDKEKPLKSSKSRSKPENGESKRPESSKSKSKTYFEHLESDDHQTTPKTQKTPRQSSEKTPTYFCTPNQNRTSKSSGTPFRTPNRRFFNEAAAQSTPECFGT